MTTALSLCAALGLRLIDVPAGEFTMGADAARFDRDRCFNERPAHTVRLTQPFRISATEVTLEQFRAFRPDFAGTTNCAPYAAGMSWHDAVAFCEWLSKTEGKPYRLPTEAEWEYVCRQSDKLGVQNLCSEPLEWCADWFGEYPDQTQTDPVGQAGGQARVVRGGCLDETTKAEDYAHASHRAGIAPAFGTYPGAPAGLGQHRIGFRVVQAPPPVAKPWPASVSFVQQGVKDTAALVRQGPDPAKPYYRKRHLLPVPPDNAPTAAIDAAGLPPSFRRHNHSPALTVCPNGDVLMVIYTSYREYEPEVSLIASRLRFGADEWDMPEPFLDFPAANDHAPLLTTDGDTVRLFWGSPHLPGAFPFQWIESHDCGATWADACFPHFLAAPGPHSRQPINSAFRDARGTLYVASDAIGASSVLWASDDAGKTWRDTGGRSAGRHTTYCPLADGRILGMGGKLSNSDGFMPQALSRDGGKTWETSATVFPALANNQRPSLQRLQSGRLLFAGDFQDIRGQRPAGVTQRGSYVALSEDGGETWHRKRLIGTQPHESAGALGGADTLGYSAACQAPNGMIHLVTTMNRPCLHFELNEAWILAPDRPKPADSALMSSAATAVAVTKEVRESFPDGKPRLVWSGGLADDGRFLLHGKETRFDAAGQKRYEASYHLGLKTGDETVWRAEGSVVSQWRHRDDGVSVWTQFWPNGSKKAESHWRGKLADGTAVCWDAAGQTVSRARFAAGLATIEQIDADATSSGPCKRVPGGAVSGAPCYLDRDYRIVSLPSALAGGVLVRTANDDDYAADDDYLTLNLDADSTVYVCYWAEANELPKWLKQEGWSRASGQARVQIGGEYKAYNVFARAAPKGRLALGGNSRARTGAVSTYFVVIQPAGPN
jgi:hypothetical protein